MTIGKEVTNSSTMAGSPVFLQIPEAKPEMLHLREGTVHDEHPKVILNKDVVLCLTIMVTDVKNDWTETHNKIFGAG